MPKPRVPAAGGIAAVRYSLRRAAEVGGMGRVRRRLRSRNVCRACGLGIGGLQGGAVDEQGRTDELSKNAVQALTSDLEPPIPEDFFRAHSIRELERWSSMQLDQAGRLAFPVILAGDDTHFRRVGWDDALDRIAAELTATAPEQALYYGSGRSSNEAAFLLQMLARSSGSSNVCSSVSFCHAASQVALQRVVGSPGSTVTLDDLEQADLVIVAGANPASNHPRLVRRLLELRRRGGTVISVNPLGELGLTRYRSTSRLRGRLGGSTVANLQLQPHVGSDVAVFRALLKGIVARDGVDRAYLRNHAQGWSTVEADCVAADDSTLAERSGIARAELDLAIDAIVSAKRGIAVWSMGLTQQRHGVQNILALANIAAARGWIGVPGGGLLPLGCHSNTQGLSSVGFAPALDRELASALSEHYDVAAEARGLDTYRALCAAAEGHIRSAVLLGGNLYGSAPDSTWAAAALRRVGLSAQLTTKLNTGHIHGRGGCTILLPVLARDEEPQATTQESVFHFVRMSEGGQSAPEGELWSEVAVICSLAARLLPRGRFPFDQMNDHRAVRAAMAQVVPGYAAIGEIDATGREFRVARRGYHEGRFDTPSGRLELHVPVDSSTALPADCFRLTTLRSEGQFNTVVYDEDDVYRGNDRRDVVMMSAHDGARLALGELDPVTVESDAGRMEAVVSFVDIPPGNLAMYYPEANRLVPRNIDGLSGTPAFRCVSARIVR